MCGLIGIGCFPGFLNSSAFTAASMSMRKYNLFDSVGNEGRSSEGSCCGEGAKDFRHDEAGVSIGRIPESVFVSARASVTAGLGKDVEAVNHYGLERQERLRRMTL